jgi:hypothetical protein
VILSGLAYDLLDLGERRFGEKHFVIAAGIGLSAVALRDLLRCFGVVFSRRPHTDRKRAQHGPRRQSWFWSRDGVHGNISWVLLGDLSGIAIKAEVSVR